MKDTLGRIICTGDVIAYASTGGSYSGLDFYYIIDGCNDGTKIRALVVNPHVIELVPEIGNMPRMFTTGEYNRTSKTYTFRSMSPDEIKHKLKTGTSRLSKGVNAYIIDDDYAQEVKRFICAHS